MTKNGFTLIELSIVLVIISLIVGGVVGGRSLVHHAEMRSVISDFNTFHTASNTFMTQYDALPCLLRDASAYWPTCDSPATNCNGDGDGYVTVAEGQRGWQMLSLATMVAGSYNGTDQYPEASYKKGSFILASDRNTIKTGFFIGLGYTTNLTTYNFVAGAITYSTIHMSGYFTPKDAIYMDKKMDDGKPQSGEVIGERDLSSLTCYTLPISANSYNITSNDRNCFIKKFVTR